MISLLNDYERGALPVPYTPWRVGSIHVARREDDPTTGAVLLQGYEQREACAATVREPRVRCFRRGFITRLRLEGLPRGVEFELSYNDDEIAGHSCDGVLDLSAAVPPSPSCVLGADAMARDCAYMAHTFGVPLRHAVDLCRIYDVSLYLGRVQDGVFVRGLAEDAPSLTLVEDTVLVLADHGIAPPTRSVGYHDVAEALRNGTCRVHVAPPIPRAAELRSIARGVTGFE